MSQEAHSKANQQGWSYKAYEATVKLGGTPEEAAKLLKKNPAHTLRDYGEFLGDVNEKKIANLLGSSGKKAIALALLGARVTVVDMVEDNQRYALECARAAGVSLDYILSDVMTWQSDPYVDHFDLVLMELGILHYFIDLNPLTKLICKILAPGGKFILHEGHPLINKYTRKQDGDQLILEGDYFSDTIIEHAAPRANVAFSAEEIEHFPQCRYKYWQLGEIVTAIGSENLLIESLMETPHGEFTTLPGTFTLVARK